MGMPPTRRKFIFARVPQGSTLGTLLMQIPIETHFFLSNLTDFKTDWIDAIARTTIASRFQVLTSFFFVAGTFRKVAISTGEAFGEICFVSVATVQTIERTPDLTANVIPIKKSKCQLKLDLGKFMLLNL
jgi:hypothetical protein